MTSASLAGEGFFHCAEKQSAAGVVSRFRIFPQIGNEDINDLGSNDGIWNAALECPLSFWNSGFAKNSLKYLSYPGSVCCVRKAKGVPKTPSLGYVAFKFTSFKNDVSRYGLGLSLRRKHQRHSSKPLHINTSKSIRPTFAQEAGV